MSSSKENKKKKEEVKGKKKIKIESQKKSTQMSFWREAKGWLPNTQSFMNILYLLFTFPLGIFYFIFLVTGFSLGIGLLVTFVGVFILAGLFIACVGLSSFEQFMAERFLGANIKRKPFPKDYEEKGILGKFMFYLSSARSWKGVFYLFLRFPIGIFSFTVVVTLMATSFGFIFTPIMNLMFEMDGIVIFQSLLNMVMGLGLLLASFHILDGLAFILGKLSEVLLSD